MPDMFQNPVGLTAARKMNTGGMGNWAEEIWDSICFIGSDGKPFHISDVAGLVYEEASGAITRDTARRYVTAFMAYARAVPADFSGPASCIVKCHHGGWYRLEDNPER